MLGRSDLSLQNANLGGKTVYFTGNLRGPFEMRQQPKIIKPLEKVLIIVFFVLFLPEDISTRTHTTLRTFFLKNIGMSSIFGKS
jgi:hypothetical protein